MMVLPSGKLSYRRRVNPLKKIKTMGDKSPKTNQKKSDQKQSRINRADQKKQQAVAARSVAAKQR